MKREFIFILILLFLFISVYGTESPYVPGELLIQLKNNVDNALETLSEDFNYFFLKPVKLLSRRMNIWLFEYKSGIHLDEQVQQGEYSAIWNGRDFNGNRVGSGIYFYKLEAGDFQKVRKMLLVK